MKSILPLLVLISLSQCGPVTKENESFLKTVIGNFVNCMNEDIGLCLKENALKFTARLAAARELKITPGLTYINSEPEKSEKAEITYSEDPEVREKQVSEKLDEQIASILDNAEIEVKLPGFDENEDNETTSARGKKGKKKLKMLIPLMLLAKAKAVALMTAFLGIIAFSIFKIMVMLKIAFIAKALAILKWLLSKHHHHHEEHGWIPHEEHHDHHGWDGGWARSKSDAQNLAYAAHRK
ncbi:hypothetical protein EVAR_12291_1 [Eumeta japonica]|uniref:Osiris 9 n=1 Tax=Eumeta variegata TaxID=151549 RepID=A0A4C1TUA8_EUMVA|nr:hypothetical protein EVAR_12291_1 [Eumeta japonica]